MRKLMNHENPVIAANIAMTVAGCLALSDICGQIRVIEYLEEEGNHSPAWVRHVETAIGEVNKLIVHLAQARREMESCLSEAVGISPENDPAHKSNIN